MSTSGSRTPRSVIHPASANTGAIVALSCLPCKHGNRLHIFTKKLVIAVDTENETRVRNLLREPEAPIACVTELGPLKVINVDPMGSTLHLAALRGYTTIVQMFLEFGVYVDLRTMVDRATPFLRACRQAHMAIMRLLIRKGAAINVADAYGRTPLHFVCASGNVEAMFMLIDLGADIYATDTSGYYPSQRASIPHQRRLTEFLNFRKMHGLRHVIGEDPAKDAEDDNPASEQRSGIFEAARKVQIHNYNIFDDTSSRGTNKKHAKVNLIETISNETQFPGLW